MLSRRFKLWLLTIAIATVFASVFLAGTVSTRSSIVRLEPDSGSPGDVIIAYGVNLDSSRVEDLSLTDGNGHALVTIVQQSETSIRFRIPAMLTKGRYTLVIHPAGRYTTSIEQPVTLTVN